MKTPREILLAHHAPAQPQLDAIRQNVVGGLGHSAERRQEAAFNIWLFCRRAVSSLRWHVAGLSALWLIIAVLNSEPAAVQMVASNQNPPPPPQLLASVRENRRQIVELIDGEVLPEVARPFVPRPRSERRPQCAIA